MEVLVVYLLMGAITTWYLLADTEAGWLEYLTFIVFWALILLWVSVKSFTGFNNRAATVTTVIIITCTVIASLLIIPIK